MSYRTLYYVTANMALSWFFFEEKPRVKLLFFVPLKGLSSETNDEILKGHNLFLKTVEPNLVEPYDIVSTIVYAG